MNNQQLQNRLARFLNEILVSLAARAMAVSWIQASMLLGLPDEHPIH
jgi:hypothetical protein